MKIFKMIWFLISITLIGTSAYFLITGEPKKETKKTETVQTEKKATTITFNGDTVSLNSVSESDANSLLTTYNETMSLDSYWWMPQEEITDLTKLGNEYRTTIANYRINIINNNTANPEKYETSLLNNKKTITKTVFNKAWTDVVGLDIPITDGNPCENLKYCNAYYKFNKTAINYTENTPTTTFNSAVKITDVNQTEDKYSVTVRALYIEQNSDKTYSIYTDPSKTKELFKSTEAKPTTETDAVFYKRIATPYYEKANKYTYTYTKNNDSFLFSGYKFEKAI